MCIVYILYIMCILGTSMLYIYKYNLDKNIKYCNEP